MSGNSSSLADLVGLILEENFGNNDATKIGSELFSNGASTILEIMKKLKLDYVTIRNGLIILVQNKLVVFEEKSRKKENPNMTSIQIDESKEVFYKFHTENCLMRLKFPKILFNIKALYGDIGQLIFEEFIMFGVMNSSQCVEAVFDKLGTSKKQDLNNIRLTFVKMIESNYIVQCSNAKVKENIYEDKKSLEKDKKKKKGKKKEDKMEEDKNEDVVIPQSSLITSQVISEEHILLFNKEKEKPYYFYINFDKIVKDMKIDLIVDLVVQKVSNPQAGLVISTMLKNSLEKDFLNGKSSAMTVDEIVKKIPEKHALKDKTVLELINKMKSEENNYVLEWGFNDKGFMTFCVNLEIIVQMIKTKTIERIIEQQFTSSHVRIYRLLSKCGPLDLKNISEICLLSQKDTASHLNQMIQENYIEFKEFNKMHFYSINLRNNIELFILKIYKMIFNIKYRLNYEIEKLKHKMEKTIESYITKVYSVISDLDETVLIIKDL